MIEEESQYIDAVESLTEVIKAAGQHGPVEADRRAAKEGRDARELEGEFGKAWRNIRGTASEELGDFAEVDDYLSSTLGPPSVGFTTFYPQRKPVVRLKFASRIDGSWDISAHHNPPGKGPMEFYQISGRNQIQEDLEKLKQSILESTQYDECR